MVYTCGVMTITCTVLIICIFKYKTRYTEITLRERGANKRNREIKCKEGWKQRPEHTWFHWGV